MNLHHALLAHNILTWLPAMNDACEVVRVHALRYCKGLEFDQGFAGDTKSLRLKVSLSCLGHRG